MLGQHAWSGVVAGTTRDSFLVSGNYLTLHGKPPVPLFRLYRFCAAKNAFMYLMKARATAGGRSSCLRIIIAWPLLRIVGRLAASLRFQPFTCANIASERRSF